MVPLGNSRHLVGFRTRPHIPSLSSSLHRSSLFRIILRALIHLQAVFLEMVFVHFTLQIRLA